MNTPDRPDLDALGKLCDAWERKPDESTPTRVLMAQTIHALIAYARRVEGERDAKAAGYEQYRASVREMSANMQAERDAALARLAAPIACPRCDRDDLTVGDLPGHLPCLSRTETEERLGEVEAERDALREMNAAWSQWCWSQHRVESQWRLSAAEDALAAVQQRQPVPVGIASAAKSPLTALEAELAALRAQVARQAKVVNLARTHAFSSGWMMKGELQDAIRALDAAGEVERD